VQRSLKKGDFIQGFEIVEELDLPELEGRGTWARHRRTGAEVFHILNDDEENLFAFAFATWPEDDTGAAHILEHTVLCGSERYPLKDAFLVLTQGSLKTYLNAITFPDKTVYPGSSVNEQDYFNLLGVYGDAVFRPLLSEWAFLQEGVRLEFGKEGHLQWNGVVYNEMKGAYSTLDTYAGFWSIRGVLPGTPYAFESGGAPEAIPGLSWENLRAFHRSRYSPGNCRIFLAGNIPLEKQLAFLEERFFREGILPSPGAGRLPPIQRAAPWKEPRSFRIPCPAGGERKATVLLSWLTGDATDNEESLALDALTETLLGHDGSPLTRALVESGLGEDLSPASGLEAETRETIFCAGLRGVEKGKAPQVEALILGELERLLREGVPGEEVEAAILGLEFSHREIRRSGGPWSLVWMRRSLQGWLHGTSPWKTLLFVPSFESLRKKIRADPHYMEGLIRRYLLENPHRALILLEPEEGFLEAKEKALAGELARMEKSLSIEEKEHLRRREAELREFQEKPDSPEALRSIPHLSRKDLSPEIKKIPREYRGAGPVPVLTHSLYTNGISYVDLAFPADILEPEDYPWVPFFARALVSLGLPGMDYGKVSSLLARTVGDYSSYPQTSSSAPGSARSAAFGSGVFDIRGRDWVVYRLKALDEKLSDGLDLARRLILEADFGDERRLRDLALEMKNDAVSSLAPGGHHYAMGRSGRAFSRSRSVFETWNGLDQLLFACRLAGMPPGEIGTHLTRLRDTLARGGLLVNLTAGNSQVEVGLKALEEQFGGFGPPRPRKEREGPVYRAGPEVFSSPSLQIGFAALSFSAAPYGTAEEAAELVMAHQLSTGALWEHLRMKGGAYGAFAAPDHLEQLFSLGTYRDPSPLRSLEAFPSIIREAAGEESEEDELVKAIIGTYSGLTRPQSPGGEGFGDFVRFLYGVEHHQRTSRLGKIIALSGEALQAAYDRAAARASGDSAFEHAVILAGPEAAKEAARSLGVEVRELPG